MDRSEYYDRVYGCWLGKNIGGTIGAPVEGVKGFVSVPYKEPEDMVANDDIDLQLVWLDVIKRKGLNITARDLADSWLKNIIYPFDEYGVAIANLRAGLNPPLTGYYNNWFMNGMGAPIRSEIWACIFPGRPEIAGWYAWQDACVDHWDEGVYGEVFFAALESAAFSSSSTLIRLVKSALAFLPDSSRIFRAVELTISLYEEGATLRETREKILSEFGHQNFTDSVQNIGFAIAGLLYGEGDLLKTVVSAVNCGYDTDCNGATCGAIIGIIMGKEKLLSAGCKNNDKIVPGWGIKDLSVPSTIGELTEQVIKIGETAKEEKGFAKISVPFHLPPQPEFEPPLSFEFLISRSFSLQDIQDVEKKVIGNRLAEFERIVFRDSFFELEKFFKKPNSAVFLKTYISLPEDKKVKLFPVSTDGVKMWVDGKMVLSHHQHSSFIPAPHRHESPLAELELEKGEHEIILEVMRCEKELEFAWLTAEGDNHLIVDIVYSNKASRSDRVSSLFIS